MSQPLGYTGAPLTSGASNGGGAYRSSGQPYPKTQSRHQQSSSYQPPAPMKINDDSNVKLGPNPYPPRTYGAEQPRQQQRQQQPGYIAQNGANAYYDMRDDVDTGTDERSVHTSGGASRTAPSRAFF